MKKITAADPISKSADLVADNLAHVKALFPEAFAEGKIDFDVLKQLLGGAVEDREEKYGLNWRGKRQARQLALRPSTGTLLPCPDESVDWDTTKNIFIEGDNLEVLKLLQKSYAGKVKLIYIDPPYNTGGDFIYPDDYRDNLKSYLHLSGQVDGTGWKVSSNTETSGRYHTGWLNMMLPRLKLARDLLADTGAIFITIDDHEVHNLRHLMDQVFGDENFVVTCAWQKVFAKKNKALISGSHDHVLVYCKSIDAWSRNLLPRDEKQLQAFKNPDNDPRGPWQSVSFSVTSEDGDRRAAYRYKIALPSGRTVSPPIGRHWNGLPERYEELLKDNRIWFGADKDNPPRAKLFLSEVQQGIVPDTWWTHDETGNNQDAKREILDLFGDAEPFSTPKPLALVRRMLQIASSATEPDLVLDFFAGSGTTGHAVLEQNLVDGGQRRYLLVQLPEPTGREDYRTIAAIGADRLRRAGAAVRERMDSGSVMDTGFRYFRLMRSSVQAWTPADGEVETLLKSAVENIAADRGESDLLFEVLLKLGLELTAVAAKKKIAGVQTLSVAAGALIVCFVARLKPSTIEPLALGIVEWHRELGPAGESVIVFRDDAFPNDIAKANMTAILAQHGLTNVRSL